MNTKALIVTIFIYLAIIVPIYFGYVIETFVVFVALIGFLGIGNIIYMSFSLFLDKD